MVARAGAGIRGWGLRNTDDYGRLSGPGASGRAFSFFGSAIPGRRNAIKEFTHRDPDFVFWIYPDGRLYDARDAHRTHIPRGFEYILEDEPDYGGFLRGRIASLFDNQLIVVYCREEALASPGPKLMQFIEGLSQIPVRVGEDTLVISDNGDLYGTVADLVTRSGAAIPDTIDL